jgi:hypothetical protein
MANQLDVLLQLVDRQPQLARELRHLMVLQKAHVLGNNLLRRRTAHAQMPQLQEQAFLQVACGNADRVEALNELQRRFNLLDRPGSHRRELFDCRHQLSIVIEIADDRFANFAHLRVVCLHR